MSRLTGAPAAAALALRRERIRIPVYLLLFVILVAETAAQSKSMFPTRGRPRRLRGDRRPGNPGLIAMVGPPYDAHERRRRRRLAARRLRRRVRRADEHVHRRPPHARGGAERAQRAGRRGAGRALRAVDGGARRGRRRRRCCSALLVALAMIGARPAGRGLARARRLAGRRRAGVRRASPPWRRRSARGRRRCTASSAPRSARAYLLRAAGDVGDGDAVVAVADRLGPVDAAVRGRALVAAGAAAGRDGRAGRPARSRCARAATRAPGSSPRGPGRRPPRRRLTRPLGLALRLQRGVLIGWSARAVRQRPLDRPHRPRRRRASSATATSSARSSARARGDIVDQYFAVSMLHDGADRRRLRRSRPRCGCAARRPRGRLEPLLATALSRRALERRPTSPSRWAARWSSWPPTGSAPALADAINSRRRRPAAAAARGRRSRRRPPCGCVVGATVALFGLVPRAALAAWGVLGACVLLTVLGPLLGLPGLGARPLAVQARPAAARGGLHRRAAAGADRRRRGADRGRLDRLPPPRRRRVVSAQRTRSVARMPAARWPSSVQYSR